MNNPNKPEPPDDEKFDYEDFSEPVKPNSKPKTPSPKFENPLKKVQDQAKNLLEKFKLPKVSLPQIKKEVKKEPASPSSPRIEPPTHPAGGVLKKFFAPFTIIGSQLARLTPAPVKKLISRHAKKIIIAGIILVIALTVKNIFFGKKAVKPLDKLISEQGATKEVAIPVKGFKISRFNFEDSLNVLGTLKGALEFKLSFEVPGVISSINYREGERYEEGALLMSLRQDDILLRLKRAQAAQRKAETDVQIAKDKVQEHEKLFAMGAIPKVTLDKVKLELEGSQYEAEAARLEMKAHESMLEKSNLYAPSAGMIGELNIEEGETVTPNTLLGSHIMTEYVYAEFGIVERDVKKIALGQKARTFVDAYPDKTFEGVIENVAPVVAGTSRTATARVRLENPDRLLLPGMFCRIRVLLYSKKNTLVVPTDAIQGSEGEQSIFVVNTQTNVAEKRAITIGYTRPDYSQVDAGVSEGEVIAISGLERLEDGKAVRLLETQEAEV